MVADVQGWLDNPASNFGWLMLGDESTNLTAKRFDTRESTSPPVLAITYVRRDTDTNSYANRNRYGDANARDPTAHADRNRDTDCYFYRYTECHAHSYTHIHAYSDRDVNAKPYSDAKVYASAEASAHSGPETLIASDRGEVITDSCRPRAHPFAKSFRRPTRCFRLYPLQIIISYDF